MSTRINYTVHELIDPTDGPEWQHDCEACRFIGRFGTHWDVYLCEQDGVYPTLVARGSDDPPDYWSGLQAVYPMTSQPWDHPRTPTCWLGVLPGGPDGPMRARVERVRGRLTITELYQE